MQSRIAALETQRDQQAALISELQSRMDASDKTLQQHTSLLQGLDTLGKNLDSLNQQVQGLQSDLSANDTQLAALLQDVQSLKVLELLSRSRLYLAENNPGLARQDLQAARTLLAASQPQGATPQPFPASLLVQRLDIAISNLPAYPVLALGDIDLVWEMLVTSSSGGAGSQTPIFNLSPLSEGFPLTPTPCTGFGCPTFTPTPCMSFGCPTLTPTACTGEGCPTSTATLSFTPAPSETAIIQLTPTPLPVDNTPTPTSTPTP